MLRTFRVSAHLATSVHYPPITESLTPNAKETPPPSKFPGIKSSSVSQLLFHFLYPPSSKITDSTLQPSNFKSTKKYVIPNGLPPLFLPVPQPSVLVRTYYAYSLVSVQASVQGGRETPQSIHSYESILSPPSILSHRSLLSNKKILP
jgi:hypothetical protein